MSLNLFRKQTVTLRSKTLRKFQRNLTHICRLNRSYFANHSSQSEGQVIGNITHERLQTTRRLVRNFQKSCDSWV